VHRVSGLALPMLLRVLNHAECTLDEIARIAFSGARNGVVVDDA
jgi:PTS system ascorbate-specific IIA component